MSNGDYHESRFAPDARRSAVWSALWKCYFSTRVRPSDTVLDLGCGYGDFINQVVAKRRIAIDQWAQMPRHVRPGVEAIVGSAVDLSSIEDNSVDYAFSSNLFEHLSKETLAQLLCQLRTKLTPEGTLTTLQPNYRYCANEYFDDYTHVSVWSHVSLTDFLDANGYETLDVRPRFLPLTVKSRLPVWQPLICAYLASPIKPLGKQMLVVARPRG